MAAHDLSMPLCRRTKLMCDPSTDSTCLAAFATLGSAVAALIAAGITAWMAVETRRMATATNRSLNLQYQPLLGIRSVPLDIGIPESTEGAADPSLATRNIQSLVVGLELFNAGQVEITYKMIQMRVSFANRTSDDGMWLSRGSRILPGSSSVFKHPVLQLNPAISGFPAKGRIRAEFEYYHDEKQPHKKLLASIEYTIYLGPAGFVIDWIFIDE